MNRREFLKTFGMGAGAVAVTGGASVTLSGCATIPTVDQMTVTAELIGRSSGMVVNLTKMTAKQKHEVIEALNYVSAVVPEVGQSYADCWYASAEKYLAEKKLDDDLKAIVLGAIKVAGQGVDYIFNKRYPDAKQYADLVQAAINGFIDGFTAVVTPSKTLQATKVYDKEAYLYLKAAANK